ncbi:sensor histidine kinase [Thalassovita sp.]|uniref:sensor histidine kinase n=1 Tax=Thalassovita sp. TaxID=1979401 RepID=UPI00288202F8|nr:ATP-binding protein [Thalassovita sp.]MDF1801312.1 ATP-binding protein [Thalassovita sp.]
MTETLIQDTLAAIPMPALMIAAGERIIDGNALAQKLLETENLADSHLLTVLRQPSVLDAIDSCRASGKPRTTRYLTTQGRNDMTYKVHCGHIRHGDRTGVLVTFLDVTHLETAEQMRRDFVANVSHELRTPLTALLGFIETLQGPAKNDEVARERFLSIMSNEAGRMNRLVRDLLSLSQVESQERIRPGETVNLGDLMGSVIRNLSPLAEKGNVTMRSDLPAAPVLIPADSDQIRQVLTNLTENAIKYGGADGKVSLSLSVMERDPALRAPAVRVQVRDAGPGIDPIHIPRLTERFYRVDSHRSREMGGTGLGLAIVKHIINRHRGRLKIESALGEGSCFTIILPL